MLDLTMEVAFSGSAGKNRNSSSATRFSATKPQVAEAQNRGLVGQSRFYPALLESPTEVCGKFRNPRVHRPFHAEKPQVEALRYPGVLGIFRICRILPIFASVAGRVHLYPRLDNGQNSKSVSILKRRQGRNCSCRRWRACLCCFRLAQRPVLGAYASVGSTPSSLRTSSKAAAMALSMS